MACSVLKMGRIIAMAGTLLLLAACAGSAPPADSSPVSMAVWDLEDLSASPYGGEGMGAILAGHIAARFSQAAHYRVVERQHLVKAMEELQIGSSELADPQTRLRLGRIIGARQMVFGAYQTVGSMLRLDLRRVDVASGRIVRTASASASIQEISGWLKAAEQAAEDLMQYP